MPRAVVPDDEEHRLSELRKLRILDTEPEAAFDDLVRLASAVAGASFAYVSLIDAERQWFKATSGFQLCELPRDRSFCAHAILRPDQVLVVPDLAEDERFADNPWVRAVPSLRFYAGVPLTLSSGVAVGTLCVLDQQPRDLDRAQLEALRSLAGQVVRLLELRAQVEELVATLSGRARIASPGTGQAILDHAPAAVTVKDLGGRYVLVNRGAEALFGRDLLGTLAADRAHERALASSEPVEDEEVTDLDGEPRTLLVRRFRLSDWSGVPYAVCTIAMDITARKADEDALRRQEALHAAVLHGAHDAIVMCDADGTIVDLNPAGEKLLGSPLEECCGSTLTSRLTGLRGTLSDHVDGRSEVLVARRDGEQVPVEMTITAVRANRTSLLCAFLTDISDRRRLEAELRRLADHDALTGLLNRRRFVEEVEARRSHQRRYGGRAALLLLDVDGFKRLNDTLGHRAGDDYLVGLAGVLRDRLRGTDRVGRLGGDEFAVLLPDATIEQARTVAESLAAAVVDFALPTEQGPVALRASTGAVVFEAGEAAVEDLLAAADEAMYTAKGRGRGEVVLQSAVPGELTPAPRSPWAKRIRDAVETGRPVLHAQPIVDIASGRIERHELLLRVPDGNGGLERPGRFLASAERLDLAADVDRWIVREAIRIAGHTELPVAVNLAGRSLGEEDLPSLIEAELEREGVAADRLHFEVSETSAMAGMGAVRALAGRLRALGCCFALDDFGTGQGSLTFLRHLPVDHVKIDAALVRALPRAAVEREVVRAITGVAHAIGPRTVAEGVEDAGTADLLAELGVDAVQGWAYGRPRPVEELLRST